MSNSLAILHNKQPTDHAATKHLDSETTGYQIGSVFGNMRQNIAKYMVRCTILTLTLKEELRAKLAICSNKTQQGRTKERSCFKDKG